MALHLHAINFGRHLSELEQYFIAVDLEGGQWHHSITH